MSGLRRARLAVGAEVLAARLATRDDNAVFDCDVLVVGSGYGGAVAAARLAGASVLDKDPQALRKATVWLLERGLEHLPGSFPARFGELPGEVRFGNQNDQAPRGNTAGLFDLRLGDDVNVLVGNGLGGGSLINAGVMERPSPAVFAQGWPHGVNLDEPALKDAYARAEAMLRPLQLPESAARPEPDKLAVLRKLAGRGAATAGGGMLARTAVNFDCSASAAGVEMAACTRCGDCVSGCNQGAKGSLDTNYLAWARRAGAELFCGGWVGHIARGTGCWLVHWHYTTGTLAPPPPLRARRVVLAAGSLGSTEILLRSRSRGLKCSQRLGAGFSTNGDQIAAIFRHDPPAHAARDEDTDPGPEPDSDASRALNIGPTICGLVRAQTPAGPIVVEEFAVPAPLKQVMGEVVTTFGLLHQVVTAGGARRRHAADIAAGHDALAVSHASLEHSSIIGLMGDDGASGVLTLKPSAGSAAHDGGISIAWPDKEPTLGRLFDAQLAWLRGAAAGVGGTVVPAPSWQMLPAALPLPAAESVATTVHPLGGCAMAEYASGGVVAHDGRVFDGDGGMHHGLVVLDGAIVPRALGINPALTIAALAERAMPELARRWGLRLAAFEPCPDGLLDLRSVGPRRCDQPAPTPRATGFRIREQMTGWLQFGGRHWWAELEVPAMHLQDLGALLPQQDRSNDLVGMIEDRPKYPSLRLYDQRGDRQPQAEVQLEGTLQLFTQRRPGCIAALCTMARGALILWQRRRGDAPAAKAAAGEHSLSLWRRLLAVVRALRTVTLWRELVYEMHVTKVCHASADLVRAGLHISAGLRGVKTLALLPRGNPWRQISELSLTFNATPDASPQPLGKLSSDLGYFARWRELLGSLSAQRDHPSALADLGSMLLLSLRIFLFTHWPLFIPPGDMPQRIAERRPGAREPGGPAPQPSPLPDTPALLFHYPAEAPVAGARPVLLIHGLSAAGSTFVHPSIPGNLVRFLNARGRDAWLLELRTSSSLDPPREGPYRFEDAALVDIPRAIEKIIAQSKSADAPTSEGLKVDVVAHCIGAAMFCLAVLHRDLPDLHRDIGRVVLSQVGPYAQMSPFNRLRGFIAAFLEDYLGLQELDTRPDHHFDAQAGARGEWVQSPRPSGSLAMVDALLSTFPYPADDGEDARAKQLLARLGRGHDFRRLRHRADGIIGHTLQLENVGDETLLALDAIYGWVKTGTLAQTIHIARQGVLTHGDGDNESVSGVRLAARFGCPVLLLHGERNQVFDWQGSLESYRALTQAFAAPADRTPEEPLTLPNGDRHWGAGTRRQFRLLHRYGHQDAMIGKDVQHEVFPAIETFFAEPESPASAPSTASRFSCDVPWMGPMLGHARTALDTFEVNLLVHAGARRAETCCVVLVPVVRERREVGPDTEREMKDVWVGDATRARGLRINQQQAPPDVAPGVDPPARPLPQRSLLLNEQLVLPFDFAGQNPPALHYAVLVLYRELQGGDEADDDYFVPTSPAADPLQVGKALSRPAVAAVQSLLDRAAAGRYDLDNAVLVLDERLWQGRDIGEASPGADLCFAVGSCQFPPALFDKVVAGNVWRRLGDVLDGKPAAKGLPRPQFMVLLGDQVYLDALGNVFEAPGRQPADQARRAYEAVWRLRPLRNVARQLPLYPMLDDHEVVNDWQPPSAIGPEDETWAALIAYRQHQAKLAPRLRLGQPSFSYCFEPAGVPFLVLDSRSRREPRDVAAPDAAHIVHPQDLGAVVAWLDKHELAPVKFIAMPAFLLPVERPELRGAEKLRLDGGSGYPATQYEILSHIREKRIHGVVLLGGDAHLSVVTSLVIDGGPTVVAIVASGLYAPWPFINARVADLRLEGHVEIGQGHRSLTGTSILHGTPCTDSAVTLIELRHAARGTPQLRVDMLDARGLRGEPQTILLNL